MAILTLPLWLFVAFVVSGVAVGLPLLTTSYLIVTTAGCSSHTVATWGLPRV